MRTPAPIVIVKMIQCPGHGLMLIFQGHQQLQKPCPFSQEATCQGHDTACKVLDRPGVNACKEHHRSSAIAVLARVRRGNTLCSICGHSFSSTQSLRTHIQGQHMDSSHLKCKKCDYSAGDSYYLKLHSRTHDPEGKKFKCDWAGYDRTYNTEGHLNEHMKIHTQGSSPPCPNCGKTFSWKYGLKSHLLKCPATPGGVPEKQFQCETLTRHTSGSLNSPDIGSLKNIKLHISELYFYPFICI